MVVLEPPGGGIVGHIEFCRPVSYWDALPSSLLRTDPRPWHAATPVRDP
ncbi:hypothetical protein ACK8HX_13600 [Oryzobacter sp. R7]